MRSHRSGSSRTVDGQTHPSSIANVFAKNYRELYSSVPYDFNKMQRITEDINCLLSSEQMSSDYIYSCNDVKDFTQVYLVIISLMPVICFLLILLFYFHLLSFMARYLIVICSLLLYQ